MDTLQKQEKEIFFLAWNKNTYEKPSSKLQNQALAKHKIDKILYLNTQENKIKLANQNDYQGFLLLLK